MSGGFRDTFTKDQDKDGQLGYDDTAFYYFASTVLLCVAVPWTFSVLYNLIFPGKAQIDQDFPTKSRQGSSFKQCMTSEMTGKYDKARREARRCTGGSTCLFLLKSGLLAMIWIAVYVLATQTGQENQIRRFDPFEILEVPHGADAQQIKKAYRKLSLVYHPDKNPDDPLAASRFIQITKAYSAMTDEVAKKNYEKYGNPDGPQATKVGIGLPRFLLEKENHLGILCAFFFLLLFVVPMTFICYYQRTKNFAPNGVMIETLQLLGHYINEGTRVKNCPELLAASAESRGMEARPTDNTQMKPISQAVVEHKKRQFQVPIIMKNQFLIWAHMQRLHHLMSPELRADTDQLLKYAMKITHAMVEIACMREWFFTAQAMIDFRRCLVQALDVKSSQLLQIPHFNEDIIKHCTKGKHPVSSLNDFISRDPEQRKGLAKMEPQQILDVEAFSSHVSAVELKAIVEVEDEQSIVVGDVATVCVQLRRKNLKEGEAMGPVHAPLFPEPKFEEWWLFLVEATPSTRIITYERLRDTEHVMEEKMRFQVSRPGKHSLVLHAMCDSYLGIDQKVELNFNAHQEEEVKREVFVHPEDEELDQQPTLFQQFMGELNHEEESEEEEEEEDKKRRNKAKKEQLESLAASKATDKVDSDDDEEDKEAEKRNAREGDSDSSSDSD
eukprot:CAMPEP_0172866898 /NCGR_PEP_ID=MMETSP1075-20121228/82245_1 /TAXON_ID=2916 /ORGANISM="Ceratium fusus, Strain PA161109" /LENGTH=668 /DNA_ID=CAMNT_0013716113 /DNA_START=33 /DNA_END=2039 /DNA_ORIENTATION=+